LFITSLTLPKSISAGVFTIKLRIQENNNLIFCMGGFVWLICVREKTSMANKDIAYVGNNLNDSTNIIFQGFPTRKNTFRSKAFMV